MAQTILFKRQRLGSEHISRISEAGTQHLVMNKIITNSPVLIKGKTFRALEITESKFREAVTFLDCRFEGPIALKEISSSAALSFINCEFDSDCTLFDLTISGSLCLIESRINGRLSIDGVSCDKLDLQSVSALDLAIVAHEIISGINTIAMDRVTVPDARINNITAIEQLAINTCHIGRLTIRHAGLQEEAHIALNDCRLNDLVIDDVKMGKIRLELKSVQTENTYITHCAISDSRLTFQETHASGMFQIRSCTYHRSTIDLSSIICKNLELDTALLEFLEAGTKKYSAIYIPSAPIENQIQTLKLLKNKFAREHRYDYEDNVFYLLKNLEARQAIDSRRWWGKPPLCLGYWLKRFIMGWGVRLRNPIISACLLIIICALGYYLILEMQYTSQSIGYLGQKIGGFYGATTLSLLTFFGQHADAQIQGHIPIGLVLAQFVSGIALTTIIVGILIRKLVR